MANNIKGITVEIGGTTAPLQNALKDVNKTIISTQTELKEVNRQLKFDPTNTDLLRQKQTLLSKEITNTKDKLGTLKEAEKQAQDQFQKGTVSEEQYRALQREVIKTESQLKNLSKQAVDTNLAIGKIKDAADKVGKGAGDVSSAMAPVTLAVVGAGAAAVKMGSDYVESLNKVDVAFKNDAKGVESWSKTTLEQYGIAGGTALDMASLFGDMGTSMGFPTDKAAGMSEKLVGLAGDLASFKNIGLDEASTALKSIFTGETESLKNLGIVMTDNNLQNYAISKGIKTKTADMTESEKVQLRYNFVMDKTKNAQGDYVRTADGTANSTRTLTERVKELSADLGQQLLPIITPIIQYVSNLIKQFSQLDLGTKQIILVVLGIVAAIAPVAKLIQGIAFVVRGLTTAVGFLTSAEFAAMLPVIVIIAGIALLVAAFVILWNKCEWFRDFWIGLWAGIQAVFTVVWDAIVGFFTVTIPAAWNGLVAFFAGIPAWWNGLWTQIGQFFTDCWNGIISFFTTTIPAWIQAVITWFNQLPYMIGYAIGAVLACIVNFGVSAWNWVTVQLPIIINGMIAWFAQLPGKIWAFLVTVVTNIGQWGANMVAKAVVEIPKFINSVVKFIQELPGKIWTFLSDVVTKVTDWCGNLIATATTEIPKFVTKVTDFVGELPKKMLDIGKNIVHGIWDGITGAVDWLHDKISGFCSGLLKGFMDNLKMKSPSRLFADNVGKNIALGIGVGFTENMKTVIASMTSAIPTSFDTSVQLNSAVSATRGATAALSAGGTTSTTTKQTGSALVFNQTVNNNSPKALSPAESNRLTRNSTRQLLLVARG